MKIGVITCWNSLENYGQVLQGYALQQVLKSMGHNPYIIRYGENESIYYKCLSSTSLKYKLIGLWKRFRHHAEYLKQTKIYSTNLLRNFMCFKTHNIIYSEQRYWTYSQLINNPPEADIYITGSDQVWSYSPQNPHFLSGFLTFAPQSILKVSYAASFGPNTYFNDNLSELTNLLKPFKAISVREQSGVELCHNAGMVAQWVLDPTFLLSKENYEHFIRPKAKHEHPYAFLYSINTKQAEDIRFSELREKLKNDQLPLIITPASGYYQSLEIYPDGIYDYASIEDWLTNIFYANYVITTSFHGVAFCIIMHKNFVFIPLNDKHKKGNDRVTKLLSYLGVDKHILTSSYEDALTSPIEWDDVDSKLNSLKESSLSFITTALS